MSETSHFVPAPSKARIVFIFTVVMLLLIRRAAAKMNVIAIMN